MLGLVRDARTCPGFSKIIKQQYLWEGLSYFVYLLLVYLFVHTSIEATVLSCRFSWVWSGISKVLRNNKSPISLERVEWFCWFFAICYLHLVRYTLKLQNYAIWAGIVRHSLLTNHIVICSKLEKLENSMRC